jgi:predicted lysophospholipase L1 biosynthesis ABC-type transport system permease subunit
LTHNLWQSQGRSRLARAVQAARVAVAIAGAVLLCMLVATLVGCVIPPSLRSDEETNSPPVILAISGDRSALAEPGPMVVEAGTTSSNLVLTLLDTDVRDDLHVRLFVDYNAPDKLPARVACKVPHNDTTPQAKRMATCNLTGLCMTSDIGMQRGLMIFVFDREPPTSGADLQAVPDPGLSSYRFFFLRCQLPQTP